MKKNETVMAERRGIKPQATLPQNYCRDYPTSHGAYGPQMFEMARTEKTRGIAFDARKT